MNNRIIQDTIRKQTQSLLTTCAVILIICLAILGFNWKYLYNFVAGPVQFGAPLAANPGPHNWVRVGGEFIPTGLSEEATLRLKKVAVEKHKSADYLKVEFEGRWLLVKVSTDFSGREVAGRLVPMPDDIAKALASGSDFYPWLVEATTGYRADFNLLVLGAVIILPFAAYCSVLFLWRRNDIGRDPALQALERFGPAVQVAERIEADLATAGPGAWVGPVAFTQSWIVVLEPLLKILVAPEVVGIGGENKRKKVGGQLVLKFYLVIWSKDKHAPEEVEMAERELQLALNKARELYPSKIVENTAEFRRSWKPAPEATVPQA
jgi:hypothetical protein